MSTSLHRRIATQVRLRNVVKFRAEAGTEAADAQSDGNNSGHYAKAAQWVWPYGGGHASHAMLFFIWAAYCLGTIEMWRPDISQVGLSHAVVLFLLLGFPVCS